MNIVIYRIARHDQADRGNVEACRIVCVSVPKGNAHEFIPFKFDGPCEFLRDLERRVDLPGKPRLPK